MHVSTGSNLHTRIHTHAKQARAHSCTHSSRLSDDAHACARVCDVEPVLLAELLDRGFGRPEVIGVELHTCVCVRVACIHARQYTSQYAWSPFGSVTSRTCKGRVCSFLSVRVRSSARSAVLFRTCAPAGICPAWKFSRTKRQTIARVSLQE